MVSGLTVKGIRKFINIYNIHGLGTDPWGTLDKTGTEGNCLPSTTTD